MNRKNLGRLLYYGSITVWICYSLVLFHAPWWLQKLILMFTMVSIVGLFFGYLAFIGYKLLQAITLERLEAYDVCDKCGKKHIKKGEKDEAN